MIEQTDIDQGQGIPQSLGDEFVGLARLGDTRRVIVSKCDVRSH